ncbi:TetR/AcrR family transcriptional regulator [Saccharopolyspora gloriosae]|uniref:TetR/AcrR family transcriptional repressor for divergent bdcA n=1 Tax=Saccharopolyspora gloriosae TaxID=455344 RepID=A0A840NNN0_9PSEU|nr:TetR/AcrR family transcriptional regulator [Saccharopolyspora gloriosae]MBB5071958.1 TetR/AcrR family transcriptional repressor for divergent bdcA [Saccharopolyspora gloriosae]
MARTGRPREFDLDSALDGAMLLFWEHGYEATSLAQLRAAMGISSASFYAAFSSKQGLFDAVVRRYNSSFGQVTDDVADEELPPRTAVERILRQSVAMQTDPSHPSGCLVVLSATAGAADHDQARALLADRRALVRRDLTACIRRAVAAGDLPAQCDPSELASAFAGFMWGISTEARDGVPRRTIDAAVGHVMRVWDSLSTSGSTAAPDAPDGGDR